MGQLYLKIYAEFLKTFSAINKINWLTSSESNLAMWTQTDYGIRLAFDSVIPLLVYIYFRKTLTHMLKKAYKTILISP